MVYKDTLDSLGSSKEDLMSGLQDATRSHASVEGWVYGVRVLITEETGCLISVPLSSKERNRALPGRPLGTEAKGQVETQTEEEEEVGREGGKEEQSIALLPPEPLQLGACCLQISFVGLPDPKPHAPPGEKTVAEKGRGEKLDKKLKKLEQNKTAATRDHQKKRAEQETVTGECKELEKKNEALKERADSLTKEIQYLKDLIEELYKARGKKGAS
ncbi:Cyclic AMP-dependent transcription factor ATF-4 [Pteropus alecto]|uniref:Cyclic AMP-dependent transcription factor ATF-4 n=1 Tax=Pteropus alecto TaxID=9402 RepID=L5KI92_PTEAL|nr:Cyclic AMP-dependent transcription factor ATF-4 [Pteropus alecto]